jgi:hypothetical protein
MENPITNDSGSLSKPVEQNVAALKSELTELKELVNKIHAQQLSKELQLPIETIENSGEIKPARRTKRGQGAIPILESEIREAQEKTHTASAAAIYLRINYYTYRKYAKLYGLWKTNIHYKKEGIIIDVEKGKYPLSRLLSGEFPNYPVYRLKDKLIQGGIKKAECEQCGYKERRITDGKMSLILNFEDGNQMNHKLENIRLLCYNCSFTSGKGYIRRGHKYHVLDDPDRVQGADEYIPKRF